MCSEQASSVSLQFLAVKDGGYFYFMGFGCQGGFRPFDARILIGNSVGIPETIEFFVKEEQRQ